MLSIIGIAPHPPIIIPEIGRDRLNEAQQTVDGMSELSRQIKEKGPEVLVIISPHGQIRQEGPAVLAGKRLQGDLGKFGFAGISLTLHTDRPLIDNLVEETALGPLKPVLLENSDPLLPESSGLDHGATVPLYYLNKAGLDIPGVHISVSFHPYSQLYDFGRCLGRAVQKRGLEAAVVASGDLSHRLKPGAPGGYSPRGIDFDRQLVELLRAGRVDEILNIDRSLVEEAGECGLRSFIIALGMLDGKGFKSEIISYEGPFGVGYLVAALHPDE